MTSPQRRLLVVTERLPLPVRGGVDLRVLGIAKAAAALGAVGVFSPFAQRTVAPPPFLDFWGSGAAPAPDQTDLLRRALSGSDNPFESFATDEAVSSIRAAVREFSPTMVVCTQLHCWLAVARAMADSTVPAVLDADTSVRRAISALESLHRTDAALRVRLRVLRAEARYEKLAAAEARAIWVSADVEAPLLAEYAGAGRVFTVPNVVDVAEYEGRDVVRLPRRLVFPANFSYPPNEYAARELVEFAAPQLPDHQFVLVGSFIPAWLREWPAPNVSAVGPVESMAEQLAASSGALMPIRAGTGSRLKILECLAASTPVVTTDVGAEGLVLKPGRDYLQAEDLEEMVAAVKELDQDPTLRSRLAAAGNEAVRASHSVQALIPILNAALDHG